MATVTVRREVQVVIYDPENNRLLALIFDTDKHLRLPKGGIEGNETHYEALRREIKEETGLDIRNGFHKVTDYVWDDSERATHHEVSAYRTQFSMFDAEVLPGAVDTGGMVVAALWVKPKEFLQRCKTHGERQVISELFPRAARSGPNGQPDTSGSRGFLQR